MKKKQNIEEQQPTTIDVIVRDLISRVNSTLSYYEKDYVSVKRTPVSNKERVTSFEQYVEARFNYECCRIPELYDAVIATDGHLFTCVSLENQDTAKRRFTLATVTLINPEMQLGMDETLKDEILKIHDLLGGSCIKFNNVKKKIKFTIEK